MTAARSLTRRAVTAGGPFEGGTTPFRAGSYDSPSFSFSAKSSWNANARVRASRLSVRSAYLCAGL